ncbi:MAG: hypothetical protein ACK40G_09555 [Cytophagaceae bacterium]
MRKTILFFVVLLIFSQCVGKNGKKTIRGAGECETCPTFKQYPKKKK